MDPTTYPFYFSHFNVRYPVGNGWALMGAADALAALELFPELKQTEEYQVLLENFQNHAGNLSFWQSEEDGRWHNIIKGKTFSI